MKTNKGEVGIFQAFRRVLSRALIVAGILFCAAKSYAQPSPPPLPNPWNYQIGNWSFEDTNWYSDYGYAPVSFTNLDNPAGFDGNALQVDSTNAAWLQYNIIEDDGFENLTFDQGTIELWVLPNWNSTTNGGSGPGDWGRLIDVGAYGTNAPSSWWSLYFTPDGNNLCFSSETNGVFTNYLNVPISWDSNTWHLVSLTYDQSQSQLFIDGQLATNGAGVQYLPGASVVSNGFFVGSDHTGMQQSHAQIDDLSTCNYVIWTAEITNDYAAGMNLISPPDSGGLMSGGFGGGGFGMDDSSDSSTDGITNLWIAQLAFTNGVLAEIVSNTQPDILYELQGKTNLVQSDWISYGFFNGSELTNWFAANVPASKQGNFFLRIRSWQDTTGTGIPDWWWLTYFGQATNVDATASAAGDGYSNLQKFQMGLNPTNYFNPNPPGGFFGCLDASGTNAFLEWSNAPGSVVNYIIQRGIQDTNGNYSYAQIGVVSSNTTLFEDVGAITNANAQHNIYNLWAVYPGGNPSGTNSWTVWWYSYDGIYGPPNGPPIPGNFWANADATGTNVLLSWTPAVGDATNYVILRGIYNPTNYAYNYTQITNVSPATTNLEFFGAITNASNWTMAYEIEAVYPGGGIATPITTLPDFYTSFASINVGANTNAPAAPVNFYGYTDSTGTNIFLTWNPASGAVTNYIVYGGVGDNTTGLIIYQQLVTLAATTNSFKVVGAVDGSGNNRYAIYNVVAVYTTNSLSQSAAWYPGNGAPAPGTLYAWLDSTGTNVQLAWTAATGAVTGYLVERSDDYSYYPYQIGQVGSSTTSLTDTNAVNTGYFDPSGTVYQVQAKYSNGGLSPAVTASVSNAPAAPTGLTATVDTTGTNVSLTWTPAVGAVSGYTVLRGTYDPSTGQYSYSTIGTTGAGTTSFEDAGVISGGNTGNYLYEVQADYPGGGVSAFDTSSVSQPLSSSAYNLTVTAQLVRNEAGHWQLMFSGIPATVATLKLYWHEYDYFDDIDWGNYNWEIDIPASNVTNGVYVIPDSQTLGQIGSYGGIFGGAYGFMAYVQAVDANGDAGNWALAGFLPLDAPCFTDGRQHLKQNLLFALRAATISQPFSINDNYYGFFGLATNFVESSIFHLEDQFKGWLNGHQVYTAMDDLWPFTVNYQLHQSLYDPGHPSVPGSFVWQQNLATVPAPAVLGVGDPYWISQPITVSSSQNGVDPATGLPIPPTYSISISPDLAAYTNSDLLYLQSGANNLFGLAFQSALVNQEISYTYPLGSAPVATYGTPLTIAPGGSTAITNVNCFFSQTTDPGLQLVNYYFAPVTTPGTMWPSSAPLNQPIPIPVTPGFATTNQTGIMVASVGTPAVIGGWAKFAITNGSSSKFAYLGQYYVTNAFVVTNGVVTTNTTGVISPYGDFFPTTPGMAALVTMPDIDTGAQGTGAVCVVALNVDANHDGTMDFSYQGSDFVSQSKPFRFWVNDNQDAGDYGGNGGIPGLPGHLGDGMNAWSYDGNLNPIYRIRGTRDLVDFFPVYLNIGSLFQSNALSAGISFTDTNWQFVLSQADGVLRFTTTDLTPTNYMNFLQDTNEARLLGGDSGGTGDTAGARLTTIPNVVNGGVPLPQSFIAGIATNNEGIILVEAAAPTTQPLLLTIYHGTNQIAQTPLFLSISGVEQMFRHKNLMLNPNATTPADRLIDASVPNEPDTIDKNFVFLHGYNVNTNEARGVAADMFKRMYWSGSHAKFYAVTWEGADTKGSFPFEDRLTPNYHTNVYNAFLTAPNLTGFLETLSGTNVVAAHSLGNMVVLSAISDWNAPISKYFMLDAAVPIEAIDPVSTTNMMVYSTWASYSNRVFASDWYQLFPTNDYRSTLFWNNRLGNLHNVDVYNFYSSGEEVLRTSAGDPPSSVLGKVITQATDFWPFGIPFGTYTWYWQEKGKGTCTQDWFLGSSHGGWLFPLNSYGDPTPLPPATANVLSNAILQVTPVFTFGSYFDSISGPFPDWDLVGTNGSAYAQTNRNRILSDAIPAMSLVAGANPVPKFSPPISPAQKNVDMTTFENGWAQGRTGDEANKWHHSDFVQMTYAFTYQLFNQFVTTGSLK